MGQKGKKVENSCEEKERNFASNVEVNVEYQRMHCAPIVL